MNKGHNTILFFLIVAIAFTFNFKANFYRSAADGFFNYFQLDGESLVIGRLLLTNEKGFTEHAGFLGWTHPEPDTNNKYQFQYEAFEKGLDFDNYEGYYSQPGVQAFLQGIICRITGWKGYDGVDKLRWIVSFFTALAFTIFLYWVFMNWGLATTVGVFVLIIFSQWITVYGRNLFWVFSAFYIPFLTALCWLHQGEPKSRYPLKITFLLMFGSIFIKFLLTGFEFMTTVMVMAVTPWVFYAVDRQWDVKKTVRGGMAACGGVLAAVFAGAIWLAAQYGAMTGTFRNGIDYLLWSFGKRTHGSSLYTYDDFLERSTQSSQWEVIARYLNNHAFHVRHWFGNSVYEFVGIVNFAFCILFFFVMSYVALSSETIRKDEAFRRRQKALVWTLWASLTAPMSWFVIFKGHSYIHFHMNAIIWYMPFMLFGFILTCNTFCYLIRHAWLSRKTSGNTDGASVEQLTDR